MYLDQPRRRRGRGLFYLLLVGLAAPALAFAIVGLSRATPEPVLEITTDTPVIGRRGMLHVRVTEPERGLSSVKVELVQGAKTRVLDEKTFPTDAPWKLWWKGEPSYSFDAPIGKDAIAELEPGPLAIKVSAGGQGSWLKAPATSSREFPLSVQLTPPLITPTAQFVFVAQGGSEVITYEVGETSTRDGVQVRDWFFRGYPLPGGKPTERFAFFGIPYDLDRADDVKLVAEDALGNRAEGSGFIHKFTPRPVGTDTINLETKFLDKVTSEILAQTPSETVAPETPLIDKFKLVNSDLRRKNNTFLRELGGKSTEAFLWRGNFLQMAGTAVKGSFADRRTYFFEGREVDRQDHLGFDLASTERAPVPAANSGVVVHAAYLGIFGNAVVIDHGYGLMSLYAHLSRIEVKVGQEVTRGQTIGVSGATGLAGGDHLHFTMLLAGMPVTPIEWWDLHWVEDRIRLKLKAALPAYNP